MSTQTALDYRTNRDLFSNYHLDEHLPETEAWNEIDKEEIQAAYDEIKELWDEQKDTVERRNESQLEEKFIRPMFRKLGIPFEVEESANETQRRPDYGFFETEADATDAFQRREDGGDFYQNAVAVADAKRWGRKLDTRGEKKRDYENPSHQIDQYLRFTSTTWGVLTNGQKWRLYYKPTSHKLDSYYEIDLPTVLETGSLEEFKYFYLFFRHEAFVPDASGDAFLDDVYEESNLFAQDLGQDLQDNIYDAIVELSEGFLQYPENDLDEDKLDLIHDSSLIYLYRIIFILYAEAEGRDLLNTNNEIYESQYSLNQLKQEVTEELESGDPKYRDWQDNLHSQLDELFTLIDQGSKSRGIPEEDLNIPAYNGGLFRTNPDESGSREARFLANNVVGDEHLARVIELLTRSESSNGAGKIFVDYSSLDVRHLGSIYEGLLEYELNIADEPLALDEGEYVVADEDSEVVVERDDVYLTTDSGERKALGSYYTPEYVVEYMVDETLRGPVDEIRQDVVMDEEYQDGGYAAEFANRVFDLKILDPAMGSGHFLTSVVDYLARAIITEQNREASEKGGDIIDDEQDINWARRKVAQRCIYGVDVNPLATELAKVSLWLRTLAAEQPLAFLDHHLKTGNSLVGSDIQDVLIDDDDSETDEGQLTLKQSFAHTRKQALDHVMDRFSELLAIDNETLEDAKEMEDVYQSVQNDPLYQKLLAMANVHTAGQFGLDVPSDAHKRMAEALRSDSWENIEGQDWFEKAQAMADDENFFHWELEFPIAFYDQTGERKTDTGFDAVIGNPPYIRSRNLPDTDKEYIKQKYNTASGSFDIYIPFVEMASNIANRNQFIIPNKWTTTNYGQGIREFLLNDSGIINITDVSSQEVFPDADIYPLILGFGGGESEEIPIRKPSSQDSLEDYTTASVQKETVEQIGGIIPVNLSPAFEPVVSSILSGSRRLGDYVEMTEAIHTGNMRDELVVEQKVDDSCRRLTDGKSIDRYLAEWNGKYIRYDESIIDNQDNGYADLRSEDLFECDQKLFIRDISYRPVAAFDDKQLYALNTLYSVTAHDDIDISLKYLLAVFNSELINAYYRQVYGGTHVGGDYLRFKPMFSHRVPIPPVESAQDMYVEGGRPALEVLCEATDTIRNAKSMRSELNLDLLDYLGNYQDGPELPDIGLFQPTESNILNSTTDDHDKLQIERARTRQDGSTVIIEATARYKPDDEDKFETDTYGYTETGYFEAFSLTNLTEEEVALVGAFVPVAVNKEIGGFRDNATKTNSLIDRLKDMTLPDLNDVASDLDRFIEVKTRSEELEQKIDDADQLIDEIVYDLYDLTDEEIDIVESAVADD
ncbi:Eco57I restriction-modification methylase domain-containing protein [Halorubrum ezzemoulense]|nr:TaqI-like C-terminal specificity domain-containing protein [Halorubrum ezzemoulense]MDB2288664.1 TaqI-like C-terminal specificity domain-containing protein [Halorubrum ezzemoulense]